VQSEAAFIRAASSAPERVFMTNIAKQYKMNFFDANANSNKVWIGIAYQNGLFEARYGRVRDGANLAASAKTFSSEAAAIAELERKRGEKLRKGYRDSATVSAGESVTVAASQTDLKTLAAQEIAAGADEATLALVEYLAQVNIHHITTATSIKYNAGNAQFSTPLGVLTPQAVKDARVLLDRIAALNNQSAAYGREAAVRDYFQLVPHDFGTKIPPASTLLATSRAVADECAILDALEAAFAPATADKTSGKVFECRLVKVPGSTAEGRATFRRVNELFKKTRNAAHATTAVRRLVRLYEVEIPAMKTAFEKKSGQIGNVRADLWHGTRASNLLSILKNGLIIPAPSAAHCTGRMFGNGIYTSLQSTKALNYATEMWNRSGSANQRTFMFLCEAALGKSYQPSRPFTNLPAGFDSAWVEAGTAGVLNHECIVYDTGQINLKYLAEFEPEGGSR
jgi:poly [ADP-ribose] polymerase 2/3/4